MQGSKAVAGAASFPRRSAAGDWTLRIDLPWPSPSPSDLVLSRLIASAVLRHRRRERGEFHVEVGSNRSRTARLSAAAHAKVAGTPGTAQNLHFISVDLLCSPCCRQSRAATDRTVLVAYVTPTCIRWSGAARSVGERRCGDPSASAAVRHRGKRFIAADQAPPRPGTHLQPMSSYMIIIPLLNFPAGFSSSAWMWRSPTAGAHASAGACQSATSLIMTSRSSGSRANTVRPVMRVHARSAHRMRPAVVQPPHAARVRFVEPQLQAMARWRVCGRCRCAFCARTRQRCA